MHRDHRWWWTAALAAVLVTWVAGIASGLGFLDEPGAAVFARIAFVRDHAAVSVGQQVGGWAMLVAASAIAALVLGARRSPRTSPRVPAVVATLAGLAMLAGWSAYGLGLRACPDVRLTWWYLAVVASSGVVVAGGVALWSSGLSSGSTTTVAPARARRSSAGSAAGSR